MLNYICKNTYICTYNKDKKIQMILSAILSFEYLAGDFPAEVSGCNKYFYEIEI